jgi:hypothetical protein
LLGFWRVKRWERNILRAQEQSANGVTTPAAPSPNHLMHMFSSVAAFPGVLREGLGFGRSRTDDANGQQISDLDETRLAELGIDQQQQRELMLARVAHDPEQHRRMTEAFRADDELIESIRAAGML